MAISNKFGALLLTTGNKSELAVGYCTLYGDMCGGLAVISDVFKTQVYALSAGSTGTRKSSRQFNRQGAQRRTAPQPDRPGQPAALRHARCHPEKLRRGRPFAPRSGRRRFRRGRRQRRHAQGRLNEYKRKQAAPGLKITPLAFGVGRRIPIVQKYVS